MHGMEIKTAVEYDILVIFMISNNRAYGNHKLRVMKFSHGVNEFMNITAFNVAALGGL